MVNQLHAWCRALRMRFFTAALIPVLLGAVIAHGDLVQAGQASRWPWSTFWLALFGAFLAQAGTNLANDYGDHVTGNDALNEVPSPFSGGSRVIQSGLLAPWQILTASLLTFAACAAVGLYLNAMLAGRPFADTPLLWIGITGCALGLAYSLGPLRLSYRGLGEVAIAIGFGPAIVLGTHYVMTASVLPTWQWPRPLWASLPVALFATLIIWINQFQDAPADAAAGKRTLVVRLSEGPGGTFQYERSLTVYRGLYALGFAAIAALGFLGLAGSNLGTPIAFLALSTLPLCLLSNRDASAWLHRWNAPDADHKRLPYELLRVNASTIVTHFATGMLLVVAYWF